MCPELSFKKLLDMTLEGPENLSCVCPSVCHICGQRGSRSGQASNQKIGSVPRILCYMSSCVQLLTITILSITTLSLFILSSLRKHHSSIAYYSHFSVNYKRLLTYFWIVLTYVSRDSTIVYSLQKSDYKRLSRNDVYEAMIE